MNGFPRELNGIKEDKKRFIDGSGCGAKKKRMVDGGGGGGSRERWGGW